MIFANANTQSDFRNFVQTKLSTRYEVALASGSKGKAETRMCMGRIDGKLKSTLSSPRISMCVVGQYECAL